MAAKGLVQIGAQLRSASTAPISDFSLPLGLLAAQAWPEPVELKVGNLPRSCRWSRGSAGTSTIFPWQPTCTRDDLALRAGKTGVPRITR